MKKLSKSLRIRVLNLIRCFLIKVSVPPEYSLFFFGLQTYTLVPPESSEAEPSIPRQQTAESNDFTDFFQLRGHLSRWFDSLPPERREFNMEELVTWSGVRRSIMNDYLAYLHKDFRTWKVEMKLERVMQVFTEDEDISISEAARQVGFRDMSNFHRQFKRVMGCSPREWRSNFRMGIPL